MDTDIILVKSIFRDHLSIDGLIYFDEHR